MAAIDTLSRNIPQLCKVAPSTPLYHMEDVHRAGGVMAILGELARGRPAPLWTARPSTVPVWATRWPTGTSCRPSAEECSHALRCGRPAGIPTQQAFSQDLRWPSLDTDRQGGCIREMAHAYSQEGVDWPCPVRQPCRAGLRGQNRRGRLRSRSASPAPPISVTAKKAAVADILRRPRESR